MQCRNIIEKDDLKIKNIKELQNQNSRAQFLDGKLHPFPTCRSFMFYFLRNKILYYLSCNIIAVYFNLLDFQMTLLP